MFSEKINNGIRGFIEIRDAETNELLLEKDNSIHYGNMAFIIARALNNQAGSYIHYMAFGNGGTSVDTSGRIIYKTPRVSEAVESSADLYNRTYSKVVSLNSVSDNIEIIPGTSFTDIKVTCTLAYNEPADQDLFDSSSTNDGEYVYDELALFGFPSDTSIGIASSRMLTHVIFHPQQKAQNRSIKVIYTIRIQLS
jgi:hypothetical protein